jgi:hypothetical protein
VAVPPAIYPDPLPKFYPKLLAWVYEKHRDNDGLRQYRNNIYRSQVIREQIRLIYENIKEKVKKGT